jgi:hypothetical protein
MMSNKELQRIAEKIYAMKKFSVAMGVQTGKSQGALIKNLTPEETATVAQLALEMMNDDHNNSRQ